MAEAAACQVPGLHVGGIDLLLPKIGSMDGTVVLEKVRDRRNDMNPLMRTLNREKAIDSLEAAYTLTLESEKRISQGFDALIRDAQETLKAIKLQTQSNSEPPALLYWQDETGDHCIYTNEVPLSITSDN